MRVIERNMLSSIARKENFKSGNTQVIFIDKENFEVRLHGNKIAVGNVNEKSVRISHAGWETNTTKSRLNALLAVNSINQRNFVWYLDNEKEFNNWEGEFALNI